MKSKWNFCRKLSGWVAGSTAIGFLALNVCGQVMAAQTTLDDIPVNVGVHPPVNVLLTPSVEFPTALTRAHKGSYDSSKEYVGYFDPDKCYKYTKTSGLPTTFNDNNAPNEYFYPVGKATGHTCSGTWSGNALNFATMSGIDTFRWALTGGNRLIDEPANGVTVLRRSYQSSQQNNIVDMEIPTPYGVRQLTSGSRGSQFFLFIDPGSTVATYFQAQVRVCDPSASAGGLESNCREYKDTNGNITYKPVGLIQRYEEKMRFGVFGYLYNKDGKFMKGGVLRARLKSVGPKSWDGTVNSAYEWDAETGVFRNHPDSGEESASDVANSGVINYLNQFGFSSRGYERYDQPSEMYAEALRYLMNKGAATEAYYNPDNVSNPPQEISSGRKDGFPVIIDWQNDPIISYCQNNAILGIGDVNTHNENNFNDFGTDSSGLARDWTAKMNAPEGLTNLATARWGDGTGGTNMIAGLAYYAHTQDIRPDLTQGKNRKMTVDTFWVDVMENGAYRHKSQYWLAAKYGGFTDKNDDGLFTPGTDTWNLQGRKYNSNDLPDNFYLASEAKAMVAGLESAFAQISKSPTLGMRAGVTWQPGTGSAMALYSGGYTTGTWSGGLTAAKFKNFKADNTVETELVWDAATKIDEQAAEPGWDTGRRILTKNAPGNGAAVPFRFDNLTAEQKAALGGSAAEQQAVLNYLRGKRDGEGMVFRQREHVLGDIVDSRVVYVGAPDALYLDATNPGYSKFKSDNVTRKEMVYAGANDGMLHAVNASLTGTDAGKELWAYIPSLLYRGPSDPATPDIDGLRALSRPSYSHRYYVNATPVINDVDFKRIDSTGKSGPWPENNVFDWRTLLVGGLGKGGKGFYAINVTKPGDITNTTTEDNIVTQKVVLWEFAPGDDMGFSYGRPLITKTKAWGWVVIVTSGYNNTSGKGILYVLHPETGAQLAAIDTGAGSPANPAGLTQVSGYTQSYTDYTTDQVYAGDLLGNLWRFDFNDPNDAGTSELVTVHKLAELKNEDGDPQPITAPPVIEWYPDNEHRWVFVGTGQFLAKSDVDNGSGTQMQTFYGIRDGSREAPGSGATLERNDLTKLENLTTGFTEIPEKGWYYDMTGTLNEATERVTYSASVLNGTVLWTGLMPQIGLDPCADSMVTGKSHIYAVDFESGKAGINKVVNDYWFDTQLVEVNGQVEVIGTTGGGGIGSDGKQKPPGAERLGEYPPGAAKLTPGVINWRRIN